MTQKQRWDPCITHRATDVATFIDEYFSKTSRKVLFIAGVGFDPRSTALATLLAEIHEPARAVFIKENRPSPPAELVERAHSNGRILTKAISNNVVEEVEIFGTDEAVIGGRNIVSVLNSQDLNEPSDVVVDVSALSVGTSFPLIRYLLQRIDQGGVQFNLHLFVVHDPKLDTTIQSVPCHTPNYIHGFRGRATLDNSTRAAKLWLPQLATGRRSALNRIHDFLDPHDTCPILPFPAADPRLGDRLAEEYLHELESVWSVDTRDIVYADEGDPLDLYRTILKLDDRRKPVFEGVDGSLLILSPLGSKIMAIGALMASLERDLPIAYLESIGYKLADSVPTISDAPNLLHIWLEGDVYPQPRPPLIQ